MPIVEEHGRNSVAAYLGNPSAHSFSAQTFGPAMLRALGSKSVFSASSVDQMPKHVSAGLMFGAPLSIPVPDVDRTMHLLILGANPLVSNGSLLTAPDMRGRIRGIRERGGKVVVVDPRRTRTAEAADEHHFIRPGGDAALMFGVLHTLFDEDLAEPGELEPLLAGWDEVERLAADFAPERVAAACGIDAEEIRRIARELAGAESAAVYARIGTCTQEFGTLASWLVDVLNAATGNLDRVGGAMFTLAAAGQANSRGAGGQRQGLGDRPLDEPRARRARGDRRAARLVPRRGDRDPGRWPGPRADHGRGQPTRVDPERRPARPPPSRASTSWSRSTSTSTRPPATPT